MNRVRNLIVFNHIPKTAGLAIKQLLQDSKKEYFIQLFDPKLNTLNQVQLQVVQSRRYVFLYTSFHPDALQRQDRQIGQTIREHSICFSVLRKPSEIFESVVRYFHDRSKQNPRYFERYLATKQILKIRDPNTIFDLCLEVKKSHNPIKSLYLFQYLRCLQNNFPISLAMCSKTLFNFMHGSNQSNCQSFFKMAQQDYFALCTVEQLELLVQFLKKQSIVPKYATLPRRNTSLDRDSILLTEDRRNTIDRKLCSTNYIMWDYILQHGPLFNDRLLEDERKLLQPTTIYF